MAREPFIFLLHPLPVFHLLPVPKQPHPKPTPTDNMQTRGRGIRIHILQPHRLFFLPVPTVISNPFSSLPRLDHLASLPYALTPHNSIALLIKSPAADFPVVTPCATLGGDEVGPKVFDDAVVLNGFYEVVAAEGNLMD